MVDGGILDHRQFIRELVTLCRERSSGTVFFNLDSGISARIVINRGEICWMAYGEFRGEEALNAIREIENGRMIFNPLLKLSIGEQILPSTPEILRLINSRDYHHHYDYDFDQTNDQDSGFRSSSQLIETNSGKYFDKGIVCEVVETEAMEFLGPIAKILCADYVKCMSSELTYHDVRLLINNMARDISSETEIKYFKDRVRRALKIE
jgi:hypothetical protein